MSQDDVNLEEFVMSKDELSGADIKAMCTEAGLLALRERRMRVRCCSLMTPVFDMRLSQLEADPHPFSHQVTQDDFVKAKEKALYRKKGNIPEGLYL